MASGLILGPSGEDVTMDALSAAVERLDNQEVAAWEEQERRDEDHKREEGP